MKKLRWLLPVSMSILPLTVAMSCNTTKKEFIDKPSENPSKEAEKPKTIPVSNTKYYKSYQSGDKINEYVVVNNFAKNPSSNPALAASIHLDWLKNAYYRVKKDDKLSILELNENNEIVSVCGVGDTVNFNIFELDEKVVKQLQEEEYYGYVPLEEVMDICKTTILSGLSGDMFNSDYSLKQEFPNLDRLKQNFPDLSLVVRKLTEDDFKIHYSDENWGEKKHEFNNWDRLMDERLDKLINRRDELKSSVLKEINNSTTQRYLNIIISKLKKHAKGMVNYHVGWELDWELDKKNSLKHELQVDRLNKVYEIIEKFNSNENINDAYYELYWFVRDSWAQSERTTLLSVEAMDIEEFDRKLQNYVININGLNRNEYTYFHKMIFLENKELNFKEKLHWVFKFEPIMEFIKNEIFNDDLLDSYVDFFNNLKFKDRDNVHRKLIEYLNEHNKETLDKLKNEYNKLNIFNEDLIILLFRVILWLI